MMLPVDRIHTQAKVSNVQARSSGDVPAIKERKYKAGADTVFQKNGGDLPGGKIIQALLGFFLK